MAKFTADLSDKFCKERGAFTVVVSDGSLIKSLRFQFHLETYMQSTISAEAAADDYETCLKHLVNTGILRTSELTGFPKFDIMLFGMGPDGHIASLFPGHGLCNESQKWVASVNDSAKPPSERITFTFPVINSSANVALIVCGSGKAEAVEAALMKTGNVPAGSVRAEDQLVWFLDKPASSKL